MTTDNALTTSVPARQPSSPPGWTHRLGYVAAIWSLGFGLLGVYWTFDGAGYPFGRHLDPNGNAISLLDLVSRNVAAPVMAVVGLLGAVLAVVAGVMVRTRTRGAFAAACVGFGGVLAVLLTAVIPDYRPLMTIARTPIFLFGMPFGFPSDVTPAEFLASMYAWPVLYQFILLSGGVTWAAMAVVSWRRRRDACLRCGRADTGGQWTRPENAARWGRRAVGVAIVIPVLYAVTRWSWALGVPIGVDKRFLDAEAAETPEIWIAGAALATLAVGGAILTLGLVQRWGEVYPRWIPFLRGKNVRPRAAIIPATIIACLLPGAGLMEVRMGLEMIAEAGSLSSSWGTVVPGFLWPLWGVALAAATLAYYYRRRGTCPACHRG